MADKREILRNPDNGFFQDLILRIKLILRLMGDRRVNPFLKLLPVAAIVYVISPIDLIPGAILPVIGALDDAAVIWLGATLFVSLCPDEVVQEHTQALHKVVAGTWRDAPQPDGSGEVIEAHSREEP
jgi:uncharacterized membrane protein YkvA (DUF1232 family)